MTPALRAFLVVAAATLATTWLTGIEHDYRPYTEQWQAAMTEAGPWVAELDGKPVPTNAYGPLHQVFAPLARVHVLAPKLVFAALLLAIYATQLRRSQGRRPWRLALLFPLHPAVVVSVTVFGNNDILPAATLVLGCSAMTRGATGRAGAWVAFGALAKFYPLLFAGFLAVRGDGRLTLRPFLTAIAVFAAGMAFAYAYWGPDTLSPFRFGQDRGAKMLSLLRFLSEYAADSALVTHLLERNVLYVLGAAGLVGLHGWMARLDWQITLLVGILAVFATYKVGHPQFYVSWIAVQAWILSAPTEAAPQRVAQGFLPLSAFLGVFQVVYLGSRLFAPNYLGGGFEIVRVFAGPAFFGVMLWCLWSVRADLFRCWQRPGGPGL